MRMIGYWMDDLREEGLCLPQELVGDLHPGVRAYLAEYLDSGTPFQVYLGYSWCRFSCGVLHEKMGSGELTDGVWAWPEGLSHYVRAHGILLPPEFIEHAISRKRPEINPKITPPTLDYWLGWCAEHRSPEFLERLSRARAEADKLAEEKLEEHAAQMAAQHGLSDQQCLWKGCDRPALIGAYICARHSLDERMIRNGCYSPSGLIRSFQQTA